MKIKWSKDKKFKKNKKEALSFKHRIYKCRDRSGTVKERNTKRTQQTAEFDRRRKGKERVKMKKNDKEIYVVCPCAWVFAIDFV